MEILDIIVILFAVSALFIAFMRLKSKAITIKMFIFWALLWCVLIALVLLRNSMGFLGDLSPGDTPFKIVVIISIVILFYLMFEIYLKIDKVEQEMTGLVRKLAIKKAKKRK